MAKKEVTTVFKIQAPGGSATPAPPIGPALGQHGVNPGQFIQQFNERTKEFGGKIVGCVITVYKDRSFEFEIRQPPAAEMIKDAAKLQKGSGAAGKETSGTLSREQLVELAKTKHAEMTAHDLDAAVRSFEGTARSMGVKIEG